MILMCLLAVGAVVKVAAFCTIAAMMEAVSVKCRN